MTARIGIVFDFDDTLAPDSTTALLSSIGVDPGEFWSQRVQKRLDADWDPIPAYLHEMIAESARRPDGRRITRELLGEHGRQIACFPGVEALFDALRAEARRTHSDIDVEFYLISSGIGEILRATRIAEQFHDIWACEFHYNDAGEIVFPRTVVSFTEKTKYMYKVSKGLIGPAARGRPFDVNEKASSFRIPFSQMIFVGDGQTDVPCFALLKQYDGVPIGVYRPDSSELRTRAWSFVRHRRVAGLYQARYEPQADLHQALLAAVSDLARRIADRMDQPLDRGVGTGRG